MGGPIIIYGHNVYSTRRSLADNSDMPSPARSQTRYSQFEPSVCEAWLQTPHKNPLSGKIINPYASQGLYKKLVKVCEKDPIGPRKASAAENNVAGTTSQAPNKGTGGNTNDAPWMPLGAAESLASVDGMITYIVARSVSPSQPFEDVLDWNSKDLTPVLSVRKAAASISNLHAAQRILEGNNPASSKRLGKAVSWIARRLSPAARGTLISSMEAQVLADLKPFAEFGQTNSTNKNSTNINTVDNNKKRNNQNVQP